MSLIYTINPSRRKHGKRTKSRKHRSAAQRAATKRMLAANRSRRHPVRSFLANPHKRRGARKAYTKGRARIRRWRLNPSLRGMSGGVVGLVKNGAIGGAGAVAADVGMSFAGRFLPPNLTARFNTDGSVNWLYYASKGVLAVALGTLGRKLPGMSNAAPRMAEGVFTVMAYEIIRGMLPATMLGAYVNAVNPAQTQRPRALSGMSRYLSAVVPDNEGSRAAKVLSARG